MFYKYGFSFLVTIFISGFAISQTAEQLYSAQLDQCLLRKSIPCLKHTVKEINYCVENGIVKYSSFDEKYQNIREIFWENKDYELIPGMLDLDIENKMAFPKYSSVSYVDSLLRSMMFRHYTQGLINDSNTVYFNDNHLAVIIDSELHLVKSYNQKKTDSICELFLQLDLDAFQKGFLSCFSSSRAMMKQLVNYSSGDLYLLYFKQMNSLFAGKIKDGHKDREELENEEECARYLHDNIYRTTQIKSKSNENISTYLFFCIDYLSLFKTVDSLNKFVGTDYLEVVSLCKNKLGKESIILPRLFNNVGNTFQSLYDSTQKPCYLDSAKKYFECSADFWSALIQTDRHSSSQNNGKDETSELVDVLYRLANVLKLKGAYGLCDTACIKILKYEKMKFGEHSDDYAGAMYKVATIEIEMNYYKNAERKLLYIITNHKLKAGDNFNLYCVLGAYSSLSRLYVKLDNFQSAKQYFDEAISVTNQLSAKPGPSNGIDFEYIYGSLYNDGGFIYAHFGKEKRDTTLLLQAAQEYKLALSFRIKKGEKDPLYLTTLADYDAVIGYSGDKKKQD
jgi:hypothetical protein